MILIIDIHVCSIYITVLYKILKLAVCSYLVMFALKLLYICLYLHLRILLGFLLSFQKEVVHVLSCVYAFPAPFLSMYRKVKVYVSLAVPINSSLQQSYSALWTFGAVWLSVSWLCPGQHAAKCPIWPIMECPEWAITCEPCWQAAEPHCKVAQHLCAYPWAQGTRGKRI